MPTKHGYDAIPDVETGESGAVHQALVLKPCDLYPEANPEEAELLGTLDSIINGSSLELNIPAVYPDDLATSSPGIGMALVWPILSAILLVIAAFSSVRSQAGGGVLDSRMFPYVAVFLMWLSSIVSINSRMIGQASLAIVSADEIRYKAAKCIENGVKIVENRVADVKGKLDSVLRAMKKKLAGVQDPTPDITDLDNALESLELASTEISASVKNVKEAIASFDDVVPPYLRSTTKYWWNAVFPVLLLCFVLQAVLLSGILAFAFKRDHRIGLLSEPFTLSRVLDTLSNKSAGAANVEMEVETIEAPAASKELATLLVLRIGVVVQSFIVAVLQIGMVYLCTGTRYVAELVNYTSDCILETTSRVARVQGLYAVTDSVLVGKMSIVKKQVLKSIMSLKVIENVDAKVATSPEKAGGFGWFGIGKK
jgi:hypothetical protein